MTEGTDDRRRWYVIQAKPKQEDRAEANLRRWNVETLSPKIRGRARDRQTNNGLVPLFPNYLFAKFDAEALLTKIRLTRGVHRVVGLGDYATPVEDTVIELIRERVTDDGLARTFQPGERVEIVEGPLRPLVGLFERHVPAHDRVIILLKTVGSLSRVEVEQEAIRKVIEPERSVA